MNNSPENQLDIVAVGPLPFDVYAEAANKMRRDAVKKLGLGLLLLFGFAAACFVYQGFELRRLALVLIVKAPFFIWAYFTSNERNNRKFFELVPRVDQWVFHQNKLVNFSEGHSHSIQYRNVSSITMTDTFISLHLKTGVLEVIPRSGFLSVSDFETVCDRIVTSITSPDSLENSDVESEQNEGDAMTIRGTYSSAEAWLLFVELSKFHPNNYRHANAILLLVTSWFFAAIMWFMIYCQQRTVSLRFLLFSLACLMGVALVDRLTDYLTKRVVRKSVDGWQIQDGGIAVNVQRLFILTPWTNIDSVEEVDEGLLLYSEKEFKDVILIPRSRVPSTEAWLRIVRKVTSSVLATK